MSQGAIAFSVFGFIVYIIGAIVTSMIYYDEYYPRSGREWSVGFWWPILFIKSLWKSFYRHVVLDDWT